jgi:hypothetical protein
MKKSELKKAISVNDLKVEGPCNDPLDTYLNRLCDNEMSILSKEIDLDGAACYSVRLEQLGQSVQLSLITSVIQHRFGDAGKRLWRILHAKGKLDDKQLAKFAMLPMKMTRELLYKMFNAKYVYIQVFFSFLDKHRTYQKQRIMLHLERFIYGPFPFLNALKQLFIVYMPL